MSLFVVIVVSVCLYFVVVFVGFLMLYFFVDFNEEKFCEQEQRLCVSSILQ